MNSGVFLFSISTPSLGDWLTLGVGAFIGSAITVTVMLCWSTWKESKAMGASEQKYADWDMKDGVWNLAGEFGRATTHDGVSTLEGAHRKWNGISDRRPSRPKAAPQPMTGPCYRISHRSRAIQEAIETFGMGKANGENAQS